MRQCFRRSSRARRFPAGVSRAPFRFSYWTSPSRCNLPAISVTLGGVTWRRSARSPVRARPPCRERRKISFRYVSTLSLVPRQRRRLIVGQSTGPGSIRRPRHAAGSGRSVPRTGRALGRIGDPSVSEETSGGLRGLALDLGGFITQREPAIPDRKRESDRPGDRGTVFDAYVETPPSVEREGRPASRWSGGRSAMIGSSEEPTRPAPHI